MSDIKRNPIPWSVEIDGDRAMLVDADGWRVFSNGNYEDGATDAATATLIVRMVNAEPEIVAVLISAARALMETASIAGHFGMADVAQRGGEAMDRIAAVLAKVRP